jgi:hypothetical protein
MAKPTTLPRWATGGTASVTEPNEAKKDLGHQVAERPPAQYFNWLFKTIYSWLLYLQDVAISVLAFGCSDLGTTSAKYLFPWYGDAAADSTRRVIVAPCAGRLKNLFVHAVAAHVGAGSSYTLTVVKNNVDTALLCSLVVGNNSASDTTHEVTVEAGDYLEIRVDVTGTVSTSAKRVSASLTLLPL